MLNIPNGRVRGIVSARAEQTPTQIAAEAVEKFAAGFAEYKAKNEAKLRELQTAFDCQAEQMAALRLNGSGIHPGAGLRRPGGAYPTLTGELAADLHNMLRGAPSASMTSQSGPDGGFTVQPEVDTVLETVLRDLSPMRSLARVVSLSSGSGGWEKIIGRTGSQSAWAGEEDSRDDSASPTLGKVSIDPWEVYAVPQLTNIVMEDSAFDLNAFMVEDVGAEFALVEGQAFVTGNGAKKPTGFLTNAKATTADATRQFGTLQYVATGAAGAFASTNPADALHDTLTALRPAYRKGDGVAWIMNSATANVIRKMKDGQGNYLWTQSIVMGQPDRLLGYPVTLDEGMPDIAANSYSVAFGNWRRGYAIVDKPGLRLIVDRVTKKGWTKMYFSKRVGGGVVDSNAIKLLKFATS